MELTKQNQNNYNQMKLGLNISKASHPTIQTMQTKLVNFNETNAAK
jgi:hypothetical protein